MRLGDKVKSLTDALGIQQCEECRKRQEWLNSLGKDLSEVFSRSKGDGDESSPVDKS